MNALPAKVAGVPEIVMVAPAPNGDLNDLVAATSPKTVSYTHLDVYKRQAPGGCQAQTH